MNLLTLEGIDIGDEARAEIRAAERIAAAHARHLERARQPRSERMELHNLPVAELASAVDAGSVDLIWTDPPYPRAFLPVWRDLAEFAVHALREGGSLLALGGQPHLPDIMRALDVDGLRWHWILTYSMNTPGSQMLQRRVRVQTKPILWFTKGAYEGRFQWDTVRVLAHGEKEYHRWGQSLVGTREVLARFADPGDMVCDPFLGGGTTAVAARDIGCAFVGADIDAACVETTRQRLEEMA